MKFGENEIKVVHPGSRYSQVGKKGSRIAYPLRHALAQLDQELTESES